MIGAAFEKLGIRDKVIIMTKAGFPGQRRWDQARRNLPEDRIKSEYLKDIEGSLKRLRTDYIDIVLHQGVASADEVADERIGEALTQLKEEGKAKYIGVSTHSGQAEVLNEVARRGFHDIALTGYNFTMAGDKDLARALENAAAKGVGIIAMKTQAGGRRRGDSGPINQAAALKWALRNEAVATAIPGYTNFDHLKENFSVAGNLELTPEEADFLADQNVTTAIEFCQQCNGCVETCPRRARIPELMRAHMYAAQYGNLVQARATLDAIPSEAGLKACTTCPSCKARCINTVNIARSIDELKLTYA
jgi:aryl-alcohol dehydrogenase-like predicted oxidoreductase